MDQPSDEPDEPKKRNIWDPDCVTDRIITFYTRIDQFYSKKKYTDVTIVCGDDETFRCHRIALAAASTFFDVMFRGDYTESDTRRDVRLPEIDGETFGEILKFVYKGAMVNITDENVLRLLKASDFLILPDIERHCIHYLINKNIPMKDAVQIHLYASSANKSSLIPATSKFLLRHLSTFCERTDFLETPYEDLASILTYFRPSSLKHREAILMAVIFRWVSNLRPHPTSEEIDEKSIFLQLTQRVSFKFISLEECCGYFEKSWPQRQRLWPCDIKQAIDQMVHVRGEEDFVGVRKKGQLSLYAILKTENKPAPPLDSNELLSRIGQHVQYASSVFEMRHSVRSPDSNPDAEAKPVVDCYRANVITPCIDRLRTVALNDRLYCLKFRWANWTFSSCTKTDLRTDLQRLSLPDSFNFFSDFTSPNLSLSMCSLENNIFLYGADLCGPYINLQHYNTYSDRWTVVEGARQNNDILPLTMTSDASRLYVILETKENRSNFTSPTLHAYDPRVGKLEALFSKGLDSLTLGPAESCSHQGRIYVCERFDDRRPACTFSMAIYDTTAGKWDFQKLRYLNIGDVRCVRPSLIKLHHRLVSFEDDLWLIGSMSGSECFDVWTCLYNPYQQEWNQHLELLLPKSLLKYNLISSQVQDVLVYKPTV